jgi:hypothetical protein
MLRKKRKISETKRIGIDVCAACGADIARDLSNYCIVCGKVLAEGYQPLDTFRSAHRLQGKSFLIENAPTGVIEDLFEVNRNPVSEIAWASCVYSMVPFVGVVFVPVTVIASFWGTGVAVVNPRAGGLKMSVASFGTGMVVLAVQLLLWWLLYVVPDLVRPF